MQYTDLQIEDIPQLVELAKELHAGATQSWIPFSEQVTYEHIATCLTRDNRKCYVAKDGDKIVGGIVCALSRSQGSNKLEAREAGIFVKENYRKKGIGGNLIRLLEAWGRENGAFSVVAGDSTLSEKYSMGDILKYKGFDLFSKEYRKKI